MWVSVGVCADVGEWEVEWVVGVGIGGGRIGSKVEGMGWPTALAQAGPAQARQNRSAL